MRRGASVLAATILMAGCAGVARAADTVSGEVVDLACYLHDSSMRGTAHKKCAETCAKKKIPMGVLTDDGQVYVLLEDSANPKGLNDALAKAAQKVTVEGTKVSQGGVNGIVVGSVK